MDVSLRSYWFFTVLFGSEANKLGLDREVPKWVKIFLQALCLIAGVLFVCWKLKQI